jgi:hypothetical protein
MGLPSSSAQLAHTVRSSYYFLLPAWFCSTPIPLGLIRGRPCSPFSRAFSSRRSPTNRSSWETLAASSEAYSTDLFIGRREPGLDRELALGYVNLASEVSRMTDVAFF